MNRRLRALVGVGIALTLPATAVAQDAPAPQPPQEKPADVQLTPSEGAKGIQGRLLELDGKTPLVGRKLVLRNVETSDVIARLTTGEEGEFALPELVNGSYALEWDGHVQYFELRQDRPLKTIKILAPKGRSEGLRLAADTGSTLIAVGAGTAIGVVGGVAGGVIGYNLRSTTGNGGGGFFGGGGGGGPGGIGGMMFETSPSGDFGSVQVGQNRQRTFLLRNNSNERLTGMVTLSNSTQFTIAANGGTFDLQPGGILAVTVTFAPTVVASHIGTLDAILTSPPPGVVATQSKALFGEGTQPPAVSPANP